MSRLADPHRCPDCRGALDADRRCTGCGLHLSGPLGVRLWQTMLTADGLIGQIRRDQEVRDQEVRDREIHTEPALVGSTVGSPLPSPGERATGRLTDGLPPAPVRRPHPTSTWPGDLGGGRPTVTGRSVSFALFFIGGLFVFVAVSLFLAVTWSLLPLAAKAVIMFTVTLGLGASAVVSAHRGLRAAAETLWVLAGSLLALDLVAARSSGLLGMDRLSPEHLAGIFGVLACVLSIGFALDARTTRAIRCLAAELGIVAGALCATWAEVLLATRGTELRHIAAILVLTLLAALLRRRLGLAGLLVVVLAGLVWLSLVGGTMADIATLSSRTESWSRLAPWPLLVATALAGLVTLDRRLPTPIRRIAAGAALAALASGVLLPSTTPTHDVVAAGVVGLALAALGATRVPHWSDSSRLGALGFAVLAAAALLVAPWATTDPSVLPTTSSGPVGLPDGLPGWTAWIGAAVLLAGLAAWSRHGVLGVLLHRFALAIAPIAITSAALVTVADRGLPLPAYEASLVLASIAGFVPALLSRRMQVHERLVPLTTAIALVGSGLVLGSGYAWLMVALTGCVTAAAAVAYVVLRHETGSSIAASVVGILGMLAVCEFVGVAVDLDQTPISIIVAVLAVVVLLAARWCGWSEPVRRTWELTAAIPALVAVIQSLPDDTSITLTILGAGIALWATIHSDRTWFSWLATAVLGGAFVARAAVEGHDLPEIATVPAAALLITAGVIRLMRDRTMNSWQVLASGLTLLIVPSLMLALVDPVSWRMLAVGVVAATALCWGIGLRWQSPVILGWGALVVIGLRFVGPVAGDILLSPFGGWILFAAAGTACLVAAISWEASWRGLRRGWGYLDALR